LSSKAGGLCRLRETGAQLYNDDGYVTGRETRPRRLVTVENRQRSLAEMGISGYDTRAAPNCFTAS
ncbi:MAG: hypothetical protein Q4P24_16960, partial [Rhodobacterales bacterium]|nr:hypothetical protein [Rhodobacterales bacterium]